MRSRAIFHTGAAAQQVQSFFLSTALIERKDLQCKFYSVAGLVGLFPEFSSKSIVALKSLRNLNLYFMKLLLVFNLKTLPKPMKMKAWRK